MPIFNWVFENQRIASGILTLKSPQKSRKQFASRRKRSLIKEAGSCLVIHSYYKFMGLIVKYKFEIDDRGYLKAGKVLT